MLDLWVTEMREAQNHYPSSRSRLSSITLINSLLDTPLRIISSSPEILIRRVPASTTIIQAQAQINTQTPRTKRRKWRNHSRCSEMNKINANRISNREEGFISSHPCSRHILTHLVNISILSKWHRVSVISLTKLSKISKLSCRRWQLTCGALPSTHLWRSRAAVGT